MTLCRTPHGDECLLCRHTHDVVAWAWLVLLALAIAGTLAWRWLI